MSENTHAMKAIEKAIVKKQRGTNGKLIHTDYAEYSETYLDYEYDDSAAWFDDVEKTLSEKKPISCPVKKQNIFQRIFGRCR